MNVKTKTLCALLLVTGLILAPLGAQEKIKFTKKELTKGSKVTIARNTSNIMAQAFEMNGQTQRMKTSSVSKDVKIFTVIAANSKGVTEAHVEFKTFENTNKMEGGMGGMGGNNEETSLLTGKTYKLKIAGGNLVAKTSEGEDVSADELAALKKELKGQMAGGVLFDPHQKMDQIIGQREVAVGEVIKIEKNLANKIFGAEDSGKNIKSITMTLRGRKKVFGVDCAVFDIKVDIDTSEMTRKGLDVTTDISGDYVVGIENLWSYSAKVAGPIKASGVIVNPNGDIPVTLDGNVSMSAMSVIQMKKAK